MNERLEATYDRPVDVLHFVVGRPQAYEGDGFPGGVEIDYALESGEVCGAKVIGYNRNGWSSKKRELAKILASHLAVRNDEVLNALKKIRA